MLTFAIMKRCRFAIGLLVALLLIPSVRATQFIPLNIEDLAARSQLILRGTVQSKTCLRDDTGRICTRIQFQVAEAWKGAVPTNVFTIVQSGGVLGEERVAVSGQAEFRVGEEVVAFLVLNQRGEGVILGLAQGKFDVWQDPQTGERFARNLFHGGPPPAVSGGKGVAPSAPRVPSNWRLKLSDLKARVQAARQ
ncbi:MAG: hypothetical protein AB1705_06555 [Verrucomicrobiota bacterium]